MSTIDAATVRRVLTGLAAHGAYFTVTVVPTPPDGEWRPVGELYDGSGLDAMVETARQRLRTDDRRVAGSILHQGYAARLWSVVVGAALAGDVVPRLTADVLWYRSTELSLVELLAVDPTGVTADAEAVATAVLDDHLHPLASAVRAATGVSAQVLAGNTASALVGALRVLAGTELDVEGRRLAANLFARPELRDTGTVHLRTSPARFERDSCCLFYRVPNGGLCGDCVLVHRQDRV